MKKQWKITIVLVFMLVSSTTYANWFADIVNRIEKTNIINAAILNGQLASLNIQSDILTSQREIEILMREVNRSVIGHSGWGNYQFHDYQSYGNGSHDWNSVMRMAENGQGNGQLGQIIGSIANQFPNDKNGFNKAISDSNLQKYYLLKSQTVLAVRAASQLDYNKIQDQISYQQMLQQQIEKAKDVKAAMDLSNRIQVEGNLINLEILRQIALTNQHQAITEQATLNTALSNAKFLTKK